MVYSTGNHIMYYISNWSYKRIIFLPNNNLECMCMRSSDLILPSFASLNTGRWWRLFNSIFPTNVRYCLIQLFHNSVNQIIDCNWFFHEASHRNGWMNFSQSITIYFSRRHETDFNIDIDFQNSFR
jgi:hypothetical protein